MEGMERKKDCKARANGVAARERENVKNVSSNNGGDADEKEDECVALSKMWSLLWSCDSFSFPFLLLSFNVYSILPHIHLLISIYLAHGKCIHV